MSSNSIINMTSLPDNTPRSDVTEQSYNRPRSAFRGLDGLILQNTTLFEPLNIQSLASRSSISSPYHRATQDLQPLPGTLLPTLQRLVQRSTNISPASSMAQKPKSSHINNPHQQSKPSNARFLSPQQQAQELEPATKRQQYSTCR